MYGAHTTENWQDATDTPVSHRTEGEVHLRTQVCVWVFPQRTQSHAPNGMQFHACIPTGGEHSSWPLPLPYASVRAP